MKKSAFFACRWWPDMIGYTHMIKKNTMKDFEDRLKNAKKKMFWTLLDLLNYNLKKGLI